MDAANQPKGDKQPPRWKTLILLCLAVYPTLNLVGLLCRPLLGEWPIWLASIVTLPITMLIVSYLILPLLMHLFAPWLSR